MENQAKKNQGMVSIIPARGGSKSLPRKNVKLLNNKPLIAYTIEAALKSKHNHHVLVSTDSEEIAETARRYGAEVPFLRPAYLTEDDTSAVDVYLHAVEYLRDNKQLKIDKFMVLLPTAPLRSSNDIDNAVELFLQKNADTLISVKKADVPLSWYLKKDEDDYVVNAGLEKGMMMNRQESKSLYIPNGAIYILDYKILKEQRTYYTNNTVAYEMPSERSVDIDYYIDFKLAEALMCENMI